LKIGSFTFLMTEACNFACSYCYQKRGQWEIESSLIEKAVEFLLPLLRKEGYVNFYGGEPLLAFEKIRRTVDLIRIKNRVRKKITYSLSTNGSLLDDKVLRFLDDNRFRVLVSFDGLAQDVSRKKGSFAALVPIIRRMGEFPRIRFRTHSVFTAETVGQLAPSLEFIVGLGVADIGFALSTLPSWDADSLSQLKRQLRIVSNSIKKSYHRDGRIPLVAFRNPPQKILHECAAGLDRLALTPDGALWGCHLFADGCQSKPLMRDLYCFGLLEAIVNEFGRLGRNIRGNYRMLGHHSYRSGRRSCVLCPDLYECRVCPADAAVATGRIGAVPPWVCRIQRIIGLERRRFWSALEA
jgi:sulfatase maturation enzyme AslB (radical SAM superfamily)